MGSIKDNLLAKEGSIKTHGYYNKDLRLKEQDPIKFEILYTKAVQAVINAREIAVAISASPVVREIGECIFGLYTPEGDAITLSIGVLIHVHTMSRMIKWMIMNDYEEKVGLKEGDYFFNNDPYIGGAHSPDQMIVTPIFYGDKLVGWAGGLSHVPETGAVEPGGLPASATSRFHEGLFMPCTRIAEHDEIKKDLEILVERSVRTPEWWLLDNRAKITGTRMIRERVKEIIGEYGEEYYKEAISEYVEDTRRATIEKTHKVLFPGRYRAVDFMGAGTRALIHCPLEMEIKKGEKMFLNFDGLSSAGKHPHNMTRPCAEGFVNCMVVQHLFYNTRYNGGTVYGMNLNLPDGTICNPPNIFYSTAILGTGLALSFAMNDCISRAYYAMGYRELMMAPNAQTSGLYCGGIDHYGRNFGAFNMEMSCCGMGPSGVMDGLDTAYAQWNPEADMGDAEVWEQILPLIWLGRYIHPDSGGFGKYRGGNEIESLYFVENTDSLEVGSFGGKLPFFTTHGIMGGYPGSKTYRNVTEKTNLAELIQQRKDLPHREGEDPANPEMKCLVKYRSIQMGSEGMYRARPLSRYDLYYQTNGNCSGFGDPIDRDPQLVAKDMLNRLTSNETARNVYCVHVDLQTFQVDEEKTQKLREERRKERKRIGIPAREYIQKTRERILRGDIPPIPKAMYNDVLSISKKFRDEFKDFWQLPEDFKQIPIREV